ncbi:MAG: KamA family radical SAM protein [Pseudomonadota bacterium]
MKKHIVAVAEEEPPGTAAQTTVSPACTGSAAPHLVPLVRNLAHPIPRLTVSPRSHAFRKRFFPAAGLRDWNDWRWQNRNRIRDLNALARIIELSPDERAAIEQHSGPLPVGITPYYASLLDAADATQALRRTVIPVTGEYRQSPGEADDPLGEDHDSPVPGLVHRYPDRVLFLVTGICTTYCRYCTRSRLVGAAGEKAIKRSYYEAALDYIERTPTIRDVLLSGGDPLSLDDERLEYLLTRLKRIPHVEFVRIGTKVPAVLPQRITPALLRLFRRYGPVWLSVHFTHPDELTPEVAEACGRLADAGVPLGSQTVLLAGVNDSVETMKRLMHGLLKLRVRPYYLYQCDPITGSAHFRTPVEKGLEIIRGLRGHTTGYAVPHYVIDAPGGGGKIPLVPDYVVGREGDDLVLRNFEHGLYRYHDPVAPTAALAPAGENLA